VSFTLDGIEIATEPATMVALACGSTAIIDGHSVQPGEFVYCEDHTDDDAEFATGHQVTSVLRTQIVPTVHI
jgi:hypothetical protein